ncbi:MAG: formate dehydrogenase accessory sulfurtransferase FdhD [Coriobacteriia bacterium]|nr:formate dehydrogenase accessory sulfurtransferase FdhD [Coriobacteriia bacterium]
MTSNENTRLPVTAAVLAGGRSMRMGVDKTLLSFDGRTLVARVCDAVGEVCEATVVVTNRPESILDVGLPADVVILRDEVAYQGPLGGLVTAMDNADTEWVLAVAADMPHLEPDLIRALWEARDAGDVVVPVSEKGPEPLLALYRVPACAQPARDVLATGRRRLVALFPQVTVVEVPLEALRAADPDLRSLVNVNTPADLAEAREAIEPHGGFVQHVRCELTPTRAMPSERPITIHLNDIEVATTQATPRDLEELAVGFLIAEGLLTDREALLSIDADAKRGLVWVTSEEEVPDDLASRTRYITSGCGKGVTFASLGHTRGLDPVVSTLAVTADEVYGLVGEMAKAADAYRDTGGTHACGLARLGVLEYVREDVGRHNALDKLLGRAWLDRVPLGDAVLISTGRISYEMSVKAAKARVPIVVSRSAVTDLAAEVADSLNITLAGYARGGRLAVYTHPERILDECAGGGQ